MNATLLEQIRRMPPERQREVADFVMFLVRKSADEVPRGRRLRQSWAGGLREFRDRFTSLQLQKMASEWRDT